jgi:signal transduction histidine kinase
MFNFALEIVCTFLMAMSLIFIVMELRARFDRSFLVFGITNLLLAFFCAIDIWMQPGAQTLAWTRIQHVIATFFPAFILWYLMILLHNERPLVIRFMFFIGICFSVLFHTNAMLKPSEKEIISTAFYNFTFAPYMVAAIIFIMAFLLRNLLKRPEKEKKVLLFHLIGGLVLAGGGIIDMITVFVGHRVVPDMATFVIPGFLLFGLIVTFVFIDRLSEIIRTREVTFGKLQNAYKELEEVQTLKELGQSTAIINHEIKNYTFIISGNAQLLLDNAQLSEKHKAIATTIVNTATKMSDFSKDILNYSRARILSDKQPIALFALIRECVHAHFAEKKDLLVTVDEDNDDLFIHGDWEKLEHVFVNIIKNSIEAGARQLSFKALRRDTVFVLIVEDDGVGCNEEQIGSLFKSFYTTKKGKGGTGLGMCVIRSIVESHGGYINAYSKNLLNDGSRGLILIMAFPIFSENIKELEGKKDPVVLIKEGVEDLAHIIRVFRNVMVTPYIFQKPDEIDSKKILLEKTAVYASPDTIDKFRKKFGDFGHTHALVHGAQNAVFVINGENDRTLHAFSEKYILENLD